MIEFIKGNIIFDICFVLAILSWILTIGALIESKRSGRYVSGIPAVGGILLIIGFLTTKYKYLAFLGFLDPYLAYLCFFIFPGMLIESIKIKRFVPPEEMEGGKVIEYTKYNKAYEEIPIPIREGNLGYQVDRINRYVIIKKNDKFNLLKIEYKDVIIQNLEFDTIEECKELVGKNINWIKK